ncbi:MAG: response regulator [Phycisphaerae bacterium]
MDPIRVLIVDDHAVLRGGLRLLIDAQPDLRVVGEAGSLPEALEVARATQPQVITLDLVMPGPSGVASVERLRGVAPHARIVVLTMHDDPAYVRAAVAMGAAGYVNKSAADTELIAAIRAVARGRVFIDFGENARLDDVLGAGASAAHGQSPVDALSEREREVLRDAARGYTNQQIADGLSLSVKTVESYRARVMRKLRLKSRADLVRIALELGLLERDQLP